MLRPEHARKLYPDNFWNRSVRNARHCEHTHWQHDMKHVRVNEDWDVGREEHRGALVLVQKRREKRGHIDFIELIVHTLRDSSSDVVRGADTVVISILRTHRVFRFEQSLHAVWT